MSFEPKKEIRDIDLVCYTGSSWEVAVMGTNAAYATLKPFLELQKQMALAHGSATRVIHFRKPWQFSIDPYTSEEITRHIGRFADFKLTFLDRMKIKLEIGLAQGSITIEGGIISVHCSEHSFEEALTTCNGRSERRQTHGRGFIDVNDGTDGIHCPPLGDWVGME